MGARLKQEKERLQRAEKQRDALQKKLD